jgi:alkylhydroperoxidase family enzyme
VYKRQHQDGQLDERMLKIVRIQASFAAACTFCVDMNSAEYENCGITDEEFSALRGRKPVDEVTSFSLREQLAIQYTRLISQTPLQFPAAITADIKLHFSEREIVILASTAAQVNYWARLIQALGISPAGFSTHCEL